MLEPVESGRSAYALEALRAVILSPLGFIFFQLYVDHTAGEHIGVDDGRTPLRKKPSDCRLPTRNISGETDEKHGRTPGGKKHCAGLCKVGTARTESQRTLSA